MNKTNPVNKLTKMVRTEERSKEALDCVIAVITESLEKCDTINLVGFGSLKVDQKAARTAKGRKNRNQGQESAEDCGQQGLKGCGE